MLISHPLLPPTHLYVPCHHCDFRLPVSTQTRLPALDSEYSSCIRPLLRILRSLLSYLSFLSIASSYVAYTDKPGLASVPV